MARLLVAAILFAAVLPSVASEPAQALDCSDWVFFEPGYSCSSVLEANEIVDYAMIRGGSVSVLDNGGAFLGVRRISAGTACGVSPVYRYELLRMENDTTHVIASVSERCVDPGRSRTDRLTATSWDTSGDPIPRFFFDANRGRVMIGLFSSCFDSDVACNATWGYGSVRWMGVIEGFSGLLEVVDTYVPPNTYGLRVPRFPEGLPATDHFDTYWGPLPGPIDFTEAQPLQCNYPFLPPQVGDYLTVNDPLPNPNVGHGYYYVTAATYHGRTRYGRMGSGGKLSGRDPALLPACVQPVAHNRTID